MDAIRPRQHSEPGPGPGDRATEALCKLSRDGVEVRILTNSLASNDVSAVHAGYSKYRRSLLRFGVRLFELDESLKDREGKMFTWLPGLAKSSLHAKNHGIRRGNHVCRLVQLRLAFPVYQQ